MPVLGISIVEVAAACGRPTAGQLSASPTWRAAGRDATRSVGKAKVRKCVFMAMNRVYRVARRGFVAVDGVGTYLERPLYRRPTVLQTYYSASQGRDHHGETTTVRLPPKLRARIHALAKQSGRSAHSVILEAVERHADYEEQMRSLVKEAHRS